MFSSADEVRDYFDPLISEKREIVVECDIALSALNSAYEYIGGVIDETETGDLLPSSSSFEIDLFDRQMRISDRIGEREDMRLRAEISADELVSERDDFIADVELEQRDDEESQDDGEEEEERQQDEAAAYFDEVLGPVDNSGVHVYEGEEDWAAAHFDEVFGPVDNSGVRIYADEEEWVRENSRI